MRAVQTKQKITILATRSVLPQKQLLYTTCLNISYKLIAISAPMRMMIVCMWQIESRELTRRGGLMLEMVG